ncbi:hypothetical protein [Streptomyces sp. Z26]|uniref:hypothetical protein n=1 Tax=Streptomyces sp. Z26 TaxID=2500177 RepID=UPI000EF16CDE|nr:hypothetical protein [Streptomyces sp. Z26]RLL66999.1 hypothetical protein D7M15_09110 [Streptomyces sp. Z26]
MLTADRWNSMLPQLVVQENDQVVTASVTPINTEISIVPEANATYLYWLYISYSASNSCGMRWQWSAPGAILCSFTQSIASPGSSGSANTPQSVNFRRPANTTGRLAGGSDSVTTPVNFHSAYDSGSFTTDSTLSPITLQFAQAVSSGGQAILRGGNQTRLAYQRVA